MKPCVICKKETNVAFNIKLQKTPICESCANAIAWQQVESLIREKNCHIEYEDFIAPFELI